MQIKSLKNIIYPSIPFSFSDDQVGKEGSGTQNNLEGIIKGRCLEFKYFTAVKKHKNFAVNVSCDDVWTKFKESFANKDPCTLNASSYDGLFNMLKKKTSDKVKSSF